MWSNERRIQDTGDQMEKFEVKERANSKMISNVFSELPPFAAGSGHTCLRSKDCLGRNTSPEGLSVRLPNQEMKTAVAKEFFAALAEGLNRAVAI